MSIRKSCKYLLLSAFVLINGFSIFANPVKSDAALLPRYSRNYEIKQFPGYQIATVHFNANGVTTTYHYALVPREASLPELPEAIPVIRIPVRRIVVLETVHIGFLDELDKLDVIVGAATTDYISNPTIRRQIENGAIQKVQVGSLLNIERLLLTRPELVVTSIPSDAAQTISAQLARTGLPVLFTAGYRERHPLARAEWIKFIAAFFEATEQAAVLFDAVAARYETLCKKVQAMESRPSVFCGAPYAGAWYVAAGESYIAQFIHDAGGDYLWRRLPGNGALPVDRERVFLRAAEADIWLNPSYYRNLTSLLGADPRFRQFRAAQNGRIYNNTRQQSAETGNPIWENGVVYPDTVLADLIKIFYPDRMPDWEFVYYEPLK